MSISHELNQASPVIDRLNAAVRENPLAAGLIGAGVAWMLFGGGKGFGKAAGAVSAAAGRAGAAMASAGGALASGLGQAGTSMASSVSEAALGVVSSSASIVPDAPLPDIGKAFEVVPHGGSAIGGGMTAAAAAGREYGSVIQSKLSESLQQQPLLLGAIGLAIGAGIASTFATTRVEGKLIGEQSSAARETLQGFAEDVTERATQVMSDVKDEAERQGLTTTTAKKAVKGVAEKAKTVAGAGRDSLKGQFSG
jgi:hypothetical protein